MSDFTTLADDSQIDPARNTVVAEKVCYSRPFSSEQRDGNKENVSMGRRREGKDGWGGDVKTRFRLSLAPLAPLQMQQDVFAGIEGKF